MNRQIRQIFEFNQFRLDVERGRLFRDGEIIPLPPKAISLLQLLLEYQGRVVEKETILETVWPDTVVEDSNLTQTVHLLRKALGKNEGSEPRIETIPKVGYRLMAEARKSYVEEKARKPGVNGDDLAENSSAPAHEPDAVLNILIPAAGAPKAVPHSQESIESVFQASRKADPRMKTRLKTRTGFRAMWVAFLNHRATKISAVAIAGVFLGLSLNLPRMGTRSSVESVAVLPFSLLNANSVDSSLSLGIADSLITKLSGAGGVEVRPTDAIRGYDGKAFDPLKVGRELGVDAVVIGHVAILKGRLRVTVQLLEVADARTLWAGKFEESSARLLELENVMADQVAAAIAAHRPALIGFINYKSIIFKPVIYSFRFLTRALEHIALARTREISR
jgi:DNA-binding winged helix-turn-helix (wHTH) protein/TolB-like protein